MHTNAIHPLPRRSPHAPYREKDKRVRGRFHYNSGNGTNHSEVRAMPKYTFCGAELEPPVHTPHTVYVKSLYRIAGQDYCRHHIIKAAVAAGVITPGENRHRYRYSGHQHQWLTDGWAFWTPGPSLIWSFQGKLF